MKKEFYFYVTAKRPQEGVQSNHLGIICVQLNTFDTPQGAMPYYKIGMAVKHPKDKMPFKCTEGRALANERATLAKVGYYNFTAVRDAIKGMVGTFEQTLTVTPAELAVRVVYVLALHSDV